MKITVATAVRNARSLVGATLASVAAQDHANREHVVVDGASTDGTDEVVRGFVPPVDRFLCEPDFGVYDAFNKCVRLATGEVIGFLNAGDTYESPQVLSRVAEQFARRDVDAVFGDLVIVSPQDTARVLRYFRSASFHPDRLAKGFMPAHPTLFLRRSLYDRLGLYDTSYRIAGDFEHCIRVFVQGNARYAHIPDVLVRMLSGGLSNSGLRSKWKITLEMQRACQHHGVPTSLATLSFRFVTKSLELLRRAP